MFSFGGVNPTKVGTVSQRRRKPKKKNNSNNEISKTHDRGIKKKMRIHTRIYSKKGKKIKKKIWKTFLITRSNLTLSGQRGQEI